MRQISGEEDLQQNEASGFVEKPVEGIHSFFEAVRNRGDISGS